ncbi:MAG TPA: uridine kinase [Candidatus Krumholzibacteriaceae bacterium]|nr:uridine kinase [Candidatus Krumholzibacteriaceae bacterium]
MKPFVIGIAGGSCSGKTSIANKFSDMLAGIGTALIRMDNYYHDLSGLALEERASINFDKPDAIDFRLLENHVEELLEGREIVIPSYNFRTHTREGPGRKARCRLPAEDAGRSVLIIEGLYALFRESLRTVMDIRVFIEAEMDICLSRRVKRDTSERGRTREGVYRQFYDTVIPMYNKYLLPTREYADLIVDASESSELAAGKIVSEFNKITRNTGA